jgi:hypothetical protein
MRRIGASVAKRFTDTNKWVDGWFSDLSEGNKLFWMFLCDNVNHAGIWDVNRKVAELHLWPGVLDQIGDLGDRVVEIVPGKWYLPKFVDFQYGPLMGLNRAHAGVIKILEKYGIDPENPSIIHGATKPHPRPYQGRKDIDKDKDKDKEGPSRDEIFDTFWKSYPKKSGKLGARREWDKLKLWERIDDVLRSVEQYKRTKQVLAGFILDPERWIKRGHWMDEVGGAATESAEDSAARTRRWIERTGGVTR